MTRDAITEHDLRRHFNAPPTFDVANHLRELGRVFVPALVGAVAIALGMYVFAASQPSEYQVSVTAKIDSGNLTNLTDVTVNMLAPPYTALSQSKSVLDDIRQRAHTSMNSEELGKNLSVTVQTSPALVLVSVQAPSSDEATDLASAAVTALDVAEMNIWNDKVKKDIRDLQEGAAATLADMDNFPDPSPGRDVLKADYDAQVQRANQLQSTVPTRLGLLSAPGTAVKVAPKPIQQAAVAGFAALVVLLEALAFLNGRVGRRTNAAWVRRLARKHGYGFENSSADSRVWPQSTQILLNRIAGAEPGPLALYSETSSAAAQFVYTVVDGTDTMVSVHTVESEWWAEGSNVSRPLAVVIIDLKNPGRKALTSSFDALDGYGIPVQLVTIKSKGAKRRKPKPDIAGAPSSSEVSVGS